MPLPQSPRSHGAFALEGWHGPEARRRASPPGFLDEELALPSASSDVCAETVPRCAEGRAVAVGERDAGADSPRVRTSKAPDEKLSDEEVEPVSKPIQVYLRIRPCAPGRSVGMNVFEIPDAQSFVVRSPSQPSSQQQQALQGSGNARNHFRFRFDRVFAETASQDQVFQEVAAPAVDSALRGVNGTIFAYGQSGSGKTFTITGGSEAFAQRGLIPRCLARVFDSIRLHRQARPTPDAEKEAGPAPLRDFTVSVSYLEIYKDKGYDLLTRDEARGRQLEDLRRVQVVEDEEGRLLFRGLSINRVDSEEEALMLLFLGDTNRIVAETSLNDCSTRSHCIFTLWIASREQGSTRTRRAKLHLVDLAGSERVKEVPSRQSESLFRETCSINLSLHYLEQVITALKTRPGTHVPYRNSALTTVLKDSLGGNCATRMVATVSAEADFLSETLATCRFAQDVAQVKNAARTNVEEDPSTVIRSLIKENRRLKTLLRRSRDFSSLAEVSADPNRLAAAQQAASELSPPEQQRCKDAVEEFLAAPDSDLALPLNAGSWRAADFCFRILRDKVRLLQRQREGHSQDFARGRLALQLEVEQRDRELATLLGLIRGGHLVDASALLVRGEVFESLRRSIRRAESVQKEGEELRRLHSAAAAKAEEAEREKSRIGEIKIELERLRERRRAERSLANAFSAADSFQSAQQEEVRLLSALGVHRDRYVRLSEAFAEKKQELVRLQTSLDRTQQRLRQDFDAWIAVLKPRPAFSQPPEEERKSLSQEEAPTPFPRPTSDVPAALPKQPAPPDSHNKPPAAQTQSLGREAQPPPTNAKAVAAAAESPCREALSTEGEGLLSPPAALARSAKDSETLDELRATQKPRSEPLQPQPPPLDSQVSFQGDFEDWSFEQLQSAFRTGDPAIDEDIAKIFAATNLN